MFTGLCKELGFPPESIPVLDQTYQTVICDPNVNVQFCLAKDSLLRPNPSSFEESTAKIIAMTNVHPYTLHMVLCVACLAPLRKIYADLGLQEKYHIYINNLKPLFIDCKEKFGVWGLKDVFWNWMFHAWQCVKLGRLHYEPYYHFSSVAYKGINKGDPVILIHIPSGTPLNMDEVTASLQMAYLHFKSRFQNETVPFITHSWLIYPPYMNGVFKEGGNLQKFIKLFDVIEVNDENFANFSTIFGCPYPGKDLAGMPQQTSLQRNMLEYIKQGGRMGQGYGIFIYGKNGIETNL